VTESTKIDFHHRRISQFSDITELIEMLFPGNRNQQYAAACIFFELKWAKGIVPNLKYIEGKYGVTRRILQRARAKLARLGLIEHVSYLNSRYGGRHGWRLSTRFEQGLKLLALRCTDFRETMGASIEKESLFVGLASANRASGRQEGDCCRNNHRGATDCAKTPSATIYTTNQSRC